MNKIFIFGCQRSGTTLLRYLLDSHSKIACPPETKFILPLIENVYEGSVSIQGLKSLKLNNKIINNNFNNFINYYLNQYANNNKKKIWADKSNHHIYIIESLQNIFSKSKVKFICLFRDGVDVSYSFLNYRKFKFKFINYDNRNSILNSSLSHWIDYNKLLKKKINNHKIYIINYENLIDNPYKEIYKLCKFLNISFEKDMIDYGNFKHDDGFGDKNVLLSNKPLHKKSLNDETLFDNKLLNEYRKLMKFFYNNRSY